MEKIYFAFYGSLRKNMYNHNFFKKYIEEELGTETITGFKLFNLGSYPCAIRTDNTHDKLVVEYYRLNQEGANYVHRMETGAGYDLDLIEHDGVKFGIYTFDKSALARLENRQVPGGDWVKFLQVPNEKTTV